MPPAAARFCLAAHWFQCGTQPHSRRDSGGRNKDMHALLGCTLVRASVPALGGRTPLNNAVSAGGGRYPQPPTPSPNPTWN